MTDIPLPAQGSSNWMAWAAEQEEASDALRAGGRGALRTGGRMVALGDSLTQGPDTPDNFGRKASLPMFAQLASGGKLLYVINRGVAGDTSALALARFDAEVAPNLPDIVPILLGTNDISQSVPMATWQANVRAIVGKCRAIGAVPVLGTIPPTNLTTPTGRKAAIIAWNMWLSTYCAAEHIVLVDYYGLLVDPANGNYRAAYYGDGTHPNGAGTVAMGSLLAAAVSPHLPPSVIPLTKDFGDANNLLADHLSQSGNVAAWTGASGTNATVSVVAGGSVAKGNLIQIATAGSTATLDMFHQATTIVAGHLYAFSGVANLTGMSGSKASARIRVKDSANAALLDQYGFNSIDQNTTGPFYTEFVAPAGAFRWQVDLMMTAGTGTAQFGQLALYDLTAMGLSSLLVPTP